MSRLRDPRILAPLGLLAACIAFRAGIALADPSLPSALAQFEETTGIDFPEWYEDVPILLTWAKGDGQAFVALAVDPLLDGPAADLRVADIRYSRIGYSLLGRIVVLGQEHLIPIGLLAVNALAVMWFGWLVGREIVRHGPRRWWLLASPASIIAFSAETAEALGVALAFTAIVAARRSSASGAATLLGMTRAELVATTTLGRHRGLALAGGVAGALAVRVIAGALDAGVGSDSINLTWPGAGYASALGQLTPVDRIVVGAVFVLAAGTVAFGAARLRGWARLGWVAYGMLMLVLSESVITSAHNILRVTGGLPLLWLATPGSPFVDSDVTGSRTRETRRPPWRQRV